MKKTIGWIIAAILFVSLYAFVSYIASFKVASIIIMGTLSLMGLVRLSVNLILSDDNDKIE